MSDKNYYMTLGIDSSGIAAVLNPALLRADYKPFKVSPLRINVGDYFNSDSQYDESLGDVVGAIEDGLTVDDLRAEKLSGWDMAGNALANNLVIAGTTAIGGILGLADGILEAVAELDISKLWDNPINNWAVETLEKARLAMPIYRGKEYEESSVWGKMGSGIFWADLVLNLGFTEGMIIPGAGVSRLLSSAPTIARAVIPSLVSSIGEASIEAVNSRNDEINSKIEIANQRYNEIVSLIQSPEVLEFVNQEYQQTLEDILNDATNAGNFVFGSNIALLSMSNSLQFGNLFSRGFGTAKRLQGALKRLGEGLASNYSINSGLYMAKTAGKKIADMFSEGMEEVSQSAISATPSNYLDYNTFNDSMFNPEKRELVSNLWSAFGKTYAETLKDPETLVEFASGFLTGAIGVPTLKFSKIPIRLENNVIGELYNTYAETKRLERLAELINQRLLQDDKIKAYYNGIVRHLSLLDRMNAALDNDDAYDYKTALSALLISDILMFDEIGDIENLRNIINQSIDTSDEGIQAIIESTSNEGFGPYMLNGNPSSIEEVKQDIEYRKLTMLNNIDSYLSDKESIETLYPNADSETIKNAMYLKGLIRDHQDRFQSLVLESYTGVRDLLLGISQLLPEEDAQRMNEVLETLTLGNFFVNYSNNPKFRDAINSALEADSFFSLDTREEIKSKLRDMEKLKDSLTNFNKSLKDILTNPGKSALDNSNLLDKAVKRLEVSEAISTVDKINNSDVSEIVQSIENGETDFDSLDSFFEDMEGSDALDKVQEAKDIIETSNSAIRDLEDLASQNQITPEELDDAKALLNNSKAVAESAEELLDLDTEAFNDPHALDSVDARETIALRAEKDGMTIEDSKLVYDDVMSMRLDSAKNALSIVKLMGLDRKAQLSEVPSTAPLPASDTETVLTGHDSIDKNEPVNAPSTQLITNKDIANDILNKSGLPTNSNNNLSTIISRILDYSDLLVKKGITDQNLILNTIRNLDSYIRLVNALSGAGNRNIIGNLNKAIADKLTETKPTTPQLTQPIQVDTTPVITPESVNIDINAENKRDINNITTEAALETTQKEGTSMSVGRVNGTYNYWRPSTTELPINRKRGDNTPYWLTVNSPARARYLAVYEYLKNHGAFTRVNNNQVKKGDEVHFGISKELSEKVGKPIILLLNSNNEVIGDLPMPEDASFNNYVGLSLLYEGASNWYKENHETLHADGNDIAVIPGYKSNIARNMVGRPQYTSLDERHTLNQISTVTASDGSLRQVPFRLGIAIANAESERVRIMSDAGRSKSQGASPLERTIIAPLRATKGQPFLLMPTSSKTRAFMPVPIMMPRFDANNPTIANSSLGQEVSKKVLELSTIPNNTDLIMKWINSMLELLSIPEIHVNFSSLELNLEGRAPLDIIVTIKKPGETKQTILYKGPQSGDIVSAVLNGLSGSMFQVSRKYINDTYNGRSYNEMIGELAETNLPIGATHTINDWFTIDPIVDKKQQKAHSPKSTRVNPTLTLGTTVRFQDAGGNTYYMTNSNRLYKENPEGNDIELLGDKYNYLKAHAYGARIGEPLTRPYDTPWGYYNPLTGKFQSKETSELPPKVDNKESESTQPQLNKSEVGLSREEALAELKKKGLLNKKERNAALDKLSDDRLAKVASMTKLKARQTLERFDAKIKSNMESDAVNETFDSVTNSKPLNREVIDLMAKEKSWSREAEIKKMSKVLPQLSEDGRVRVVDGLIRIAGTKNPSYAWGQFQNGIITLSNRAARGTMYHEAFHFVTLTLLTQLELDSLYNDAKKRYNKSKRLELEEELAEDFRRFMLSYEDDGFFKNIFKTLKHIIKNLLGKETITNKLFHDIRRGALASRAVNTSNNTLYRGTSMLYDELQLLLESAKLDAKRAVGDIFNRYNKFRKDPKTLKEWEGNLLQYTSAGYMTDSEAISNIPMEYKDFLDVVADQGKYIIVYRLNSINTIADEAKANADLEVRKLERQIRDFDVEESYLREVQLYYNERLDYGRLNLEQRDYITERGLTLDEYNSMTPLLKEVLFKCMY